MEDVDLSGVLGHGEGATGAEGISPTNGGKGMTEEEREMEIMLRMVEANSRRVARAKSRQQELQEEESETTQLQQPKQKKKKKKSVKEDDDGEDDQDDGREQHGQP